MIENSDFRIEEPDLSSKYDVDLIRRFLSPLGFYFDESSVEYSVILYNLNDDIVGVGSCLGKILKYVAVAPRFRESGAFAHIVTHLTEHVMNHYQQAFVFTRPDNILRFEGLGYRHIASAQPLISVLEFGYKDINDYKKYLGTIRSMGGEKQVAAIVMNGNPFTLGHQYLIEKAAEENELVYVFVVETEKSVFKFGDRYEMIRRGTRHLPNVRLVKGGEYVVSCATFPNYFLKNETPDMVTQKQAELDIEIFCKHIVPQLGICKRYVGTENYCATTQLYNQAMKTILPFKGVELIEVERKQLTEGVAGDFISASKVRQAIKNDDAQRLNQLLPQSTIEYLKEMNLGAIEQQLKTADLRH
ncbi:[citrate (pro-3S)-lyase] ligase [Carboxylicivirga mesophila]|uniref:[Citrate [pro-3S]-lyase] ligase n=1 Tax=Carboxylicivirga mesophila TaxID=1166478 RepID=A0ABS5K7P7_9BACT|nr:[citrate (pro-3S)-lyase] ligase [Carboxylicivirga mesophila]MBS2211026.1 [citrate (pro-3S)-lyase] ligase [Carboxylicivirga mesophila]